MTQLSRLPASDCRVGSNHAGNQQATLLVSVQCDVAVFSPSIIIEGEDKFHEFRWIGCGLAIRVVSEALQRAASQN
jgi:hypothetical protein